MKKKLLLSLLPMALLAGCFEDDSVLTPEATETGPSVFVMATDYVGSYKVQKIQGSTLTDVATETNDAVVCVSDSVLYVINRSKAVVTAYHAGKHFLFQKNVGIGTNPYHVTKADGKLYVSRLHADNLLVLDPTTGDSIGSLDLSAYASPGKRLAPVQTELVNGKLWILAQGFQADYSYDTARVIFAEVGATKASGAISLKLLNPQNLVVHSGKAYVAARGTYDTLHNAGIEIVDVATRTRFSTLTGPMGFAKPSKIAIASGKLWAVAAGSWPKGEAVPVDMTTGVFGTAIPSLVSANDLVSDGTNLWIGDRSSGDNHVVAKVDPFTGAVLSSVKTALPPASMAVIP